MTINLIRAISQGGGPELVRKVRSLSSLQRSALVALLKHRGVNVSGVDTITRLPGAVNDSIRLSYTQQRLWFLEQLYGSNEAYNVPIVARMKGHLDKASLQLAFDALLQRHEALRTRFVDRGGVPYQYIDRDGDYSIHEKDLSDPNALLSLCKQEVATPFNLEQDALIRAKLLRISDDEHIFLVTMHHCVTDGWSVGIFVHDLSVLYDSFCAGHPAPLEPLPVQYLDYSDWQRRQLESGEYDAQVEYWRKQLAGIDSRLTFPLDHERPLSKTYRGARESIYGSVELLQQLRSISSQHGMTLYMTLLAAYAVVLHSYSGETDIAVGTVVAGRTRVEIEQLIGFFANTLVIRSDLSGDPAFSDFLGRVKKISLEAYDNQDVPFEAVVEALQLERSLNLSPIFQTMFVLQEAQTREEAQGNELEISAVEFDPKVAKFDITVELCEASNGLVGFVEYNTDLFESHSIRRFIDHYLGLLAAVAEDPKMRLSELSAICSNELNQSVARRSEINSDAVWEGRCLHENFEAVVARTPDAIALVCEDRHLSYRDINARANRLARHLRVLGVGPDTLVALCLPRSEQIVICILAVLKSGGAYVPLDPAVPVARLEHVLQDSDPQVLLVDGPVPEGLKTYEVPVIDIRKDTGSWSRHSEENLQRVEIGCSPTNLAYVIYTSGSTGIPKGVMVEHRNVTRLFTATNSWFGFGREDVWTLFHSFAFDFSVWEIWGSLLYGGRLIVVPQAVTRDPPEFYKLLCTSGVTILNQTPSAFRELIVAQGEDGSSHQLRSVVFGGEALNVASLKPWMDRSANSDTKLVNMYGITETTVHVTYRLLEKHDADRTVSPIGCAIPDLRLHVLDERMNPVARGAVGELYVGGKGVARGYLNRPELTKERFVPDRECKEPGARLYKTGDLVRELPDGTLEYLGRNDDQVKIRGFRIELGEIEHRLTEHPEVRSCAVIAREDDLGHSKLVAYLVLGEGPIAEVDYPKKLAKHLSQTLPDYMVPRAFVLLNALPLTANGKLDRQALPLPDVDAFAQLPYVAATTAIEESLVSLCAELLGLEEDKVSTQSNFFMLGGHSLLIPVLVARLKELGFSASVRDVYHTSSLMELADRLNAVGSEPSYKIPPNLIPPKCEYITPSMLPLVTLSQKEVDSVVASVPGGAPNVQDIYPLVSAQEGIFFHHLLDPEKDPYVVATLFVADGDIACESFVKALQAIVDRHDVMRTAIVTAGLPVPVQVVYRRVQLPVERLRLKGDVEQQARVILNHPGQIVLEHAPLHSLVIAEDTCSEKRYIILKIHHIIEDATSLRLTLEELAIHLAGRVEQLSPAPPYRDFVAHTLHNFVREDVEAHFRTTLGDVTEPTTPFGLTNVRGDARRYPQLRRSLPSELTCGIREQALRLRTTPACLFHAAWVCVAAASSGRDDVVFGTVMSGRMQGVPGVEQMLGNFINTLPFRVKLVGKSVKDLVADVDVGLKELIVREQSPLSLVQRCSGIAHGTPLFTSVINVRHFEAKHGDAAPPPTEDRGIQWIAEADSVNYPILVSLDDFGSELSLLAQVDKMVSCDVVLDYVESALASIVSSLARDEGVSVKALDVFPALKQQRNNSDIDNTPVCDEWKSRCLHENFEAMVAKNPEAIAIIYEGHSFSYGELNVRANRLARHLRELEIGPGTLVALCLPRSEQIIVSILAVLKAGGAYVPLDPSVPVSRLEYVLHDSAPHVLLVDGPIPNGLQTNEIAVVDVRADAGRWSDQSGKNLERAEVGCTPTDLAYVIYTSGSTGTPKGVMVEHRSVTWLFSSTTGWFGIGCEDVWALFHSFAFDVSVWEIWGALLYGGRLVIISQDVIRNPKELYKLLCSTGVTMLNQTPSSFVELISAQGENGVKHRLRSVVFAGEALNVASLKPWMERSINDGTELVNMYGVTEATVFSTYKLLDKGDAEHSVSPIGCGIPGLRIYVLDESGKPVERGTVGELYIGGKGVAREYLNRPDLTKERFLPDQMCIDSGARMYKTGDLVRELPDGSLEYHGRNDDQVQIRGFRVELGEIEAELVQHDAVALAVVSAKPSDNTHSLIAYVRPTISWLDNIANKQNAEYVDRWQRIFEDQYAGSEDIKDDLNLSGWKSNYTGDSIPESEMREWIDGAVRQIKALKPRRLLEVGCGTGLLLFRYAEHCESVHALDVSAAALDYIQRGVAKRGWTHVCLSQGDALSASVLSENLYDTIVINSVAQYFPNHLYFEQVVAQSLSILEDGGSIFIGDVRNLDLLSAHVCAVERTHMSDSTTAGELLTKVQVRHRREGELLFSPTYFASLKERFSAIGAVDIVVKRGVFDNEMLAYRYDVVLTKGTIELDEPLQWLNASTGQELREILDGGAPDRFGVSGLTNFRIADDVQFSENLKRWPNTRQVESLAKSARLSTTAVDEVRALEAALVHAEELGYWVSATWSQDRRQGLDLVLGRDKLPRVKAQAPYREARLYNFPRIGEVGPTMARVLKDHLATRLPTYMIPSAFVLLEEIPLTPNGKIDKRALPAPDDDGVAKEIYVAPSTELQGVLCRLFEEVLGLSSVGVKDRFFDLGGHSLVAVRLTMRVRNEIGRELALQQLLNNASVEELASILESEQPQTQSKSVSLVPVAPVQDGEESPLSLQQQDLWFLNRPEYLGISYNNIQFGFCISGSLDREAYVQSVQSLVERHAVLRTSYFARPNGVVVQQSNKSEKFNVMLTEVADQAALDQWLKVEKAQPFLPDDQYMVRVGLLMLSGDEHVVVVTRPWGIFDGWSVNVLMLELLAMYRAMSQKSAPELLPLPLQYADFARWQRRVIDETELDRQRLFWSRKLSGLPACISLRTDYPRRRAKSYQGSSENFVVPLDVLDRIRALGQQCGATLYMVLLSAFAVLVGEHAEDSDIAIGSPFTNRPREELESLIGYFTNNLVMRLNVDRDRSFVELLEQARQVTAEAHEHKDLPFVDLVRTMVPHPDSAYSPLFQVMFNLLPAPSTAIDGEDPGGLRIAPLVVHPTVAKFDLSLTIRESEYGLHGSLMYSTDLFAHASIVHMTQRYGQILVSILEDERCEVSQLWSDTSQSGIQKNCSDGDVR